MMGQVAVSIWLILVNMICLHAFLPRTAIRPSATRFFTSASPSLLSSSPSPSSRSRPTFSQNKKTGGLRRLPVVKPPNELISRATKQATFIRPDATVKNARLRARKHAAERLNALQQTLCIPLRDIVNGYKVEWKKLHPFERVVADLTARARQQKDGLTLNQVLDDIHEARKMILELSKDWIAKAKTAETAKEADLFLEEATQSMVALFTQFASPPVAGILDLQRSLRTAPIVALDTPAVVLVGAPNVGKSSIVRAISSGTPEVNGYPFTTRAMTLGHVQVFWKNDNTIVGATVPDSVASRRKNREIQDSTTSSYAFAQLCQVMDSPGLLVRDNEDERNEMEALTLAAMQHLPTAVMYVMDLSGNAGDKCSSIADQLQLRREVRARFPKRPWIDVVSKFDLGTEEGALEKLEDLLDGTPYIKLSIHDGDGVPELKQEVLRMLGQVRVVLDAMAAVNAGQ